MERIKTTSTIEAQRERQQFELDNTPLAVRVYGDLYLKTYGRKPLHPMQITLLEKGKGSATYANIFRKIIYFLYSQRLANNAANNIHSLLHDYFSEIIKKYLRHGRAPTIKQISPSPTNTSIFISFTIRQENITGTPYWLSAEDQAEADKLIQSGGTKFKDPFIEEARKLL